MAHARLELRRSEAYQTLGVIKVDLLFEGSPDGRKLHALPHRWFPMDKHWGGGFVRPQGRPFD